MSLLWQSSGYGKPNLWDMRHFMINYWLVASSFINDVLFKVFSKCFFNLPSSASSKLFIVSTDGAGPLWLRDIKCPKTLGSYLTFGLRQLAARLRDRCLFGFFRIGSSALWCSSRKAQRFERTKTFFRGLNNMLWSKSINIAYDEVCF